MPICSRCGIWELRDDDNYCSLCQNKFVSLDLEIEPSRFPHDDIPPPARLTVLNNSTKNEIVVQSIVATEAWVAVSVSGNDIQFPFTLGPGKWRDFQVHLNPLDVEDEYATARIQVCSNAGSETRVIEIVPPPEMRISTGEYEIFLDEKAMEQNLAQISVSTGVVTILGVSADPAEWASVQPAGDVRFPLTLDARGANELALRIVIDEKHLLSLPGKYPAVYDGKLRVRCQEFEREEAFRVKCWMPPAMLIWEEREPRIEAFAGKRGELVVSIQNKEHGDPTDGRGNAALEIRSIEVRNRDGSENRAFVCRDPLTEPIRVEGGALRRFRFGFDTDGCGVPMLELGIGKHRVNAVLTTNLSEPVRILPLEIVVSRMKVFEGVLAVDLGTSNTCAAILGDRDPQFTLLDLDSKEHNKNPKTVPTLIQYCSLTPANKRVIRIGAYVESISTDPKVAGTTVRSPKRRLGRSEETDRFEVRYFNDSEREASLFAREVVADYLNDVRLKAEEHGKAVFKEITITHPSRFRLRQLRDLEAAVRVAFGPDCNITLLQEPVAAALGFIVGAEALAAERYTLGVFDLGGGTTDLTLVSVENGRQGHLIEISARLISSTGKWFGGEDLTKFVQNAGLEKCRAIARKRHSQAEIFTQPQESPDLGSRWLVRQNESALQRWAEQSKLLLLQYGDKHETEPLPGIFPSLKLNVFTPSGVEDNYFPHLEIVPKDTTLYQYLEEELMKLVQMLRGLVEKSPEKSLDYVLLSGKSSAIPHVADVLRREFPKSKVVTATEPKECVVSGACILATLRRGHDMSIHIPGGTAATVSRIGYESVAGGERMFQELVAAGVPIPERGLTLERMILLHRRSQFRLLENDGDGTALWSRGKESADISELGVFAVANPPDWLTAKPTPATLQLTVSQNLEFSLTAKVEGFDDVVRFEDKRATCGAAA